MRCATRAPRVAEYYPGSAKGRPGFFTIQKGETEMDDFRRSAPPLTLVLASLVLWVSFAWGLPAEAPATEGEADLASVEDPWAGVRISDAYDDLRCPYCWGYNELTAARCPSCGHEFAQPSGEYAYPPWFFVPGKGYYREGTLLEPGKKRKGYSIAGIVLMASGLAAGALTQDYDIDIIGGIALGALSVGAGFIVYSLVARTKPVYAFASDERFGPFNPTAYAQRLTDPDGAALKVEVTLLGF